MILVAIKPKRRKTKDVIDVIERMTVLVEWMHESSVQWHHSEIDMLMRAVVSHFIQRNGMHPIGPAIDGIQKEIRAKINKARAK
jgi:hypothetical protein